MHLSNANIEYGAVASLKDTQYQASIRLVEKDTTFGEGHICGGSLISPRVVLTAAHCLFDLNTNMPRHPAELNVVMGTINRYQKTEHTLLSQVTHIRYPLTFDPITRRDDIGLLFLSQEIPDNHKIVRPIEVNQKSVSSEIHGAMTGWGKSQTGHTSHHLIAVNVSTMDPFNCAKTFGRLVTDNMLCAKQTEIDTDICQSDVGSPLVYGGKQIGIVSWPNSCSIKDYPVVYTNVAHHSDWIWSEVADQGNADSSIWGLVGFLTLTWYAFRDRPKMQLR